MPYRVEFTPGADGDLSRLDTPVAQRVLRRLDWLAENAESARHGALVGQLQGLFKIRVGDYRAVYSLDRESRRIIVQAVGHRSEIYNPR
jgi:mRNA interferase RelE/StbE